jgi:NAD(P)H-flavin reductase
MPVRAMPDLPRPYRVVATRQETHDTWTLRLAPAGHDSLEPFRPGQFAMIYAFGKGEVPVSVSARAGGGLVHTVRAVGAITAAICAARPGDVLGVRGPFGTAWPLQQAEGGDVVVIAGGLGLAPLRPAVHHLLAHRDRYGRVSVLYGGRAPAELIYTDQLECWQRRPDMHVAVTVDRPDAGWRGRVGVAGRLLDDAPFDPARTVAMVCGPEVMMRFTAADLADRGVPTEAIWLSLERSMKCGAGHCGHCQLGPLLICRDGPVLRHSDVAGLMQVAQL